MAVKLHQSLYGHKHNHKGGVRSKDLQLAWRECGPHPDAAIPRVVPADPPPVPLTLPSSDRDSTSPAWTANFD